MLKIGIILFAVTPLLQLATGHIHAIEVINMQPEKAAAYEGHFYTTRGAPLYAAGFVDEQNEKTYGIYMPKALSFLYNFDWNSEIKGLNDFSKENWPPVNFVFQVYHIMAGIGMLLIVLGLLGAYLLWTGKIYENKLYLFILPLLIPLPHVAHETGWIAAEVGRQPWIIYKLMKTADAASVVVSAGEIVFSLIMFFLIYLLLAVMFVKIFLKIVQKRSGRVMQMKNSKKIALLFVPIITVYGIWCVWDYWNLFREGRIGDGLFGSSRGSVPLFVVPVIGIWMEFSGLWNIVNATQDWD